VPEFAGTIQPAQPLYDTWKWGHFRPKNGSRQIYASLDYLSGNDNLASIRVQYALEAILLAYTILWPKTRMQQNQVHSGVTVCDVGNGLVNRLGTVYSIADDERSSRHFRWRTSQALKHLLVFGHDALSCIRILHRPIWLAFKLLGCHSSLTKHALLVCSFGVRQLKNEICRPLVAISVAPPASKPSRPNQRIVSA
jgi:hypothetical protein